ncbi:MAG TPA: class II aldolase/adducin family protein [Oscillospiraceae bacterium]|nr:class II aldolase/adducin family protein [Oscillospiraceae bacterium]
MDENALRRAVCETGRLLWERGLIAGSDGNLSARLADGAVLLTPSGVSKGGLTPEALVVLDADGAPLRGAGKPSSEWRMHLAIYRARPEVGAVVHAHPPCATAFAAAGRVLPLLLPEAVLTLRRIGVAPYALPSSQALADGAAAALADGDAAILMGHGAVTVAADLGAAWERMETLEHCAKVALYAQALGGGVPLAEEAVAALDALREGRRAAH